MVKFALVTGSTAGMGKAIASKLAQNGCNVMIHGLCELEAIKEQAAELSRAHGVEVLASTADLTNASAIREMVDSVHCRFDRVDILINNAGVQHVAPVHEFPDDQFRRIIDVMLTAPFIATKAVLPRMLEAGWGRIINTSSFHGLVASPFKAPYVAAKHGIAGFTKATALEVAKQGITVNSICPGYVHTELVERQLQASAHTRGITPEEVIRDVLLKPQPIGRFVKVEEVAAFVSFLCSDDAAAITGAVLPIDGGWTCQ